ncbi:MAG: formate dehydrogenase accessory protein FdhE [Desulfobacterales bacterium]|jgi:FdhE protein|nr:formate dehydrogenase accessory protein FdhE [Desulfobacterales bacterium]
MINLNFSSDNTDQNRTEKKIALLRQMREKLSHYREMLDFFEPIFEWRQRYADALASCPDMRITDDPAYLIRHQKGFPMLTKGDIRVESPIISDYFLKLLSIIKTQAPEKSEMIDGLIDKNGKFRFDVLIGHDFNRAPAVPDNVMIDFLIEETLGPLLDMYSRELGHHIKRSAWSDGFCPVCGKKPAFALLADDGKRILVCSTCSFEWDFKRIKCTFCGNEDQQLLAYLTVENEDMYRIETCDACHGYLKTIDLKNAAHEIVYDIEAIITLHLDIIAGNHGYFNVRQQTSAGTIDQPN